MNKSESMSLYVKSCAYIDKKKEKYCDRINVILFSFCFNKEVSFSNTYGLVM